MARTADLIVQPQGRNAHRHQALDQESPGEAAPADLVAKVRLRLGNADGRQLLHQAFVCNLAPGHLSP